MSSRPLRRIPPQGKRPRRGFTHDPAAAEFIRPGSAVVPVECDTPQIEPSDFVSGAIRNLHPHHDTGIPLDGSHCSQVHGV